LSTIIVVAASAFLTAVAIRCTTSFVTSPLKRPKLSTNTLFWAFVKDIAARAAPGSFTT
jgi:hypothetical protein